MSRRFINPVSRGDSGGVTNPEVPVVEAPPAPVSGQNLYWGKGLFNEELFSSSEGPLADFSFAWPLATNEVLSFYVASDIHEAIGFEIEGQLVLFPSEPAVLGIGGMSRAFTRYYSEHPQFGVVEAIVRVQ